MELRNTHTYIHCIHQHLKVSWKTIFRSASLNTLQLVHLFAILVQLLLNKIYKHSSLICLKSLCSLDFSVSLYIRHDRATCYFPSTTVVRAHLTPLHSCIWCSASHSLIPKSGALQGSATSKLHSAHFALQRSTNQSIPIIKIYTGPPFSACFGALLYSAICEYWRRSLPVACVCHLLACLYGQMQADPAPPWSLEFVQVQIISSTAAAHHS